MGGAGALKMSAALTLEAEEEVESQSTFAARRRCSCAAAPTIPTAVKYRPWDLLLLRRAVLAPGVVEPLLPTFRGSQCQIGLLCC